MSFAAHSFMDATQQSVAGSFQFTSAASGSPVEAVGYSVANATGSISAQSGSLTGRIYGIYSQYTTPAGPVGSFYFLIYGSLPQNIFNTVTITGNAAQSSSTASSYNNFGTFTLWSWAAGAGVPDLHAAGGGPFSVTVT